MKSLKRQRNDGYRADWGGRQKGDVFVHLLSSSVSLYQEGCVNGDNLFLACLSTTLKLLHNYKLSKGTYIARESENVSLYCHVFSLV